MGSKIIWFTEKGRNDSNSIFSYILKISCFFYLHFKLFSSFRFLNSSFFSFIFHILKLSSLLEIYSSFFFQNISSSFFILFFLLSFLLYSLSPESCFFLFYSFLLLFTEKLFSRNTWVKIFYVKMHKA